MMNNLFHIIISIALIFLSGIIIDKYIWKLAEKILSIVRRKNGKKVSKDK